MEGLEVFNAEHVWHPLSLFGIDIPFVAISIATLVNTWIVLLVLTVFIVVFRYLTTKSAVATFLVHSSVNSFIELCVQSLGTFNYHHFVFVFSIFVFILFCNWIALIPFVEEPTKDINTTLALGCISFFYKEFYAIKTHGIVAYFKEFFHPFFVMFPLNFISHFSKIISISFRLFGNIFGGSIITHIYTSAVSLSFFTELFGLVTGMNFLVLGFFIIFEGLIQAFVFTMLTLTYLAIAVQSEEEGAAV
jgi:F-type H+-transporting ATPase subunit a